MTRNSNQTTRTGTRLGARQIGGCGTGKHVTIVTSVTLSVVNKMDPSIHHGHLTVPFFPHSHTIRSLFVAY